MTILDPDIPSQELTAALNKAAELLSTLKKQLLTPELLLLAFLRTPESAAYRFLERLTRERGFRLADLERAVQEQAQARSGHDADFYFLADDGHRVPFSDEMVIVMDEGRAIAQAMDEVWVGTEHALAAMAQAGVSTAGLLQRHGVTPSALTDILANRVLTRQATTRDLVALARQGELPPLYYRENLLRYLISLLTLAEDRHTILVGPEGVGKRSLVYSLAQLIAEGKGPADIRSVVEIAEAALLDNAEMAVRAGLRQARSGVLLVPNIHRFFGGRLYSEFPTAARHLQKAFLDDRVVIVGTTTSSGYESRLAGHPAIVEHSHLLRVPPASVEETIAILDTLRGRLELDYELRIAEESLPVAANLAKRYLSATPLPGAAVHLLHRACALVRMSTQRELAFRPQLPPDARLDAEDITLALSLIHI